VLCVCVPRIALRRWVLANVPPLNVPVCALYVKYLSCVVVLTCKHFAVLTGKSAEELMGEWGKPLLDHQRRASEEGANSNLSSWRSVSGGSADRE
jgi:hypothetical protein